MPVMRVKTHGFDPGQKIQDEIEAIEKQGGEVGSILPLQEEILIVWSKPKRETRTTRDRETR